MRKTDYALLATLLAAQVERARADHDVADDAETLRRADARIRELEQLAHAFARRASVARDDFVAACGFYLKGR